MRNIPVLFCVGMISIFGGLTSCKEPLTTPEPTPLLETPTQGDRLKIVVSILPQQYFVEKIGGDKVAVSVMVGAGAEAETYEPKPQQLKALSDADAYINVGIFFEDIWESRFQTTNPKMAIVNSAAGIEKIEMVAHDHDHGAEHPEDEQLLDPHTWLSPKRVAIHAENIYAALVKLDPSSETFYRQNLDNFLAEIAELDADITATLANLDSRTFLVFHPAWGYFAEDYDLEQIAIEVEGQKPSAAELAELITVAKQEQSRVIFAQYQFNSQTAQAIAAEIGAEVVYIDPLAPNWAENLQSIAQEIAIANSK